MPHITTARGKFYYADHRTAEVAHLPLMVLVHGAGGSRLDWPGTLRKLNTLTIDLNGHGKSEGQGHQRIIEYAKDINAVLEALNINQAILAGHSMGGAIVQMVALEFPARVSGLILLGTGAHLPVNPMIINDVIDHQEKVVDALAKWMWNRDVPEDKRQMTKTLTMQVPPHILQGDYIACNAFDVRERLAEIQVPTLVIAGEADKMTSITLNRELSEKIPDAVLVVLENAGHMMALEQPETVKTHIVQWLEKMR